MEGNKRIAKNTLALYIRMAITMFFSFYTTRITLEVLGVEDYGLNNLVSTVVALFSFLNGSMGTAVQRFYSVEIGKDSEDKLGRVFGSGLSLHMIVAIITILIMEIFAIFFLNKLNIPESRMFAAQIVFQISIVSMALNILSVPYTALLRAREEFSKIAIADVIYSIGRLIVVYFLLSIEYDHLITLGILNFIITLLYLAFMYCAARRYKECRQSCCWDRDIVMSIAKFISMLIVTVLASLFRDKGIVVLVNLFFGLAINAAYAVAMQVMGIVNTFVMNFKQSVVPQIMISYGKNDLQRMNNLINIGTKATFLLMLLISFPVIFEGEYILELWLKEPPQYSYELVCLVVINVNISSFTYFMYQGVHAAGKIAHQQITMSMLYILNIAGIYIVFKLGYIFYYGIFVTIVISLLQCFTNLYFAKKSYNYSISIFMKSILPQCIFTIVITAIITYLITNKLESSFIRLIISTFSSSVLVIMIGYLLVLNNNEKKLFTKFVEGFIRSKKNDIDIKNQDNL